MRFKFINHIIKFDEEFSHIIFRCSNYLDPSWKVRKFFLCPNRYFGAPIGALLVFFYPNNILIKLSAVCFGFISTFLISENILKSIIQRTRPSYSFLRGSYSFPSSHAFNIVVICVLLYFLSEEKSLFGFLVHVTPILFVSFFRVSLGVHYIGDVLGGWFFAILYLTVIVYLLF
ncbi:phosphatase PAP2 family protein [Candidatus Dojkabacteria bacterium]|uniref:Phosphatase PAP2 family protein n=1 Tax=Candidatus Dojkabacteria bacterium TaxID=2099670 RepID=A0A3M0Z0C1_9BACT|nr:MAG: phosphatase PAP2 family protein [Candidatus Dojkabacteria bacterium]